MYPDRDTSRNVPRSGYITARDQSMVQSGVIESGNFNFCEWTQQNKKYGAWTCKETIQTAHKWRDTATGWGQGFRKYKESD